MNDNLLQQILQSLPKIELGGFDLTLPVWGGGGVLAVLAVLWFLLQLWNNLRQAFGPKQASEKTVKDGFAKADEAATEIKRQTETIDETTADTNEIDRALSSADPDNAEARRDLSVSLEKLGNVAMSSGDLAGAARAYGESLEIARALSAADPDNAEARRDLSVSLQKLGNVAVSSGDLAGAATAYGESLEILRALSSG